jgi:L-asparaginase II
LLANGWHSDYRSPEHPLQRAILASVSERTGGAVCGAVIDGCGVPCWVVPLEGMARAWARLAAETAAGEAHPLGRIGWAMTRNPWHASGTGALDGAIMEGASRPMVAKIGAEGLICAALPEEGLGLAVKVTSGSAPARAAAVIAMLDRWFPGLIPSGVAAPWKVVRNWVGTECGELLAAWEP